MRSLWILIFMLLFMQKVIANTEVYDPFSDYSDFEITKEEEKDINFFNADKFLSLGLAVYYVTPTRGLSSHFDSVQSFGFFINYWFDLRTAVQVDFLSRTHDFKDILGVNVSGKSEFSEISLNVKYYVNPNDIVYSLALLNPHVMFGIGTLSRTFTAQGENIGQGDSGLIYHGALGIEIPMGTSFFIGLQAKYSISTILGSKSQKGGLASVSALFGINF